jgi:hypothetical protein
MLSIKEHHAAITKACNYQVWQLKRKNRSHWSFEEDWSQEIYAHCLSTRLQYDPTRGGLSTYYGTVAANAACNIGRKITRDAKLFMYQEDVDLRSGVASSNDSDWDSDDEKPNFEPSHDWERESSFEHFAANEFQNELATVISKMKPEMKALYELVKNSEDCGDAQRLSGLPKSTFYSRVKALRMHLERHLVCSPDKNKNNR